MKTNIELEQIHDVQVLDIIERHKKGGLCFVGSKRHVKANNHYLEDFDSTKPENYLMYWDANNLYGWAMSQYLPYKNLALNKDIGIDEILKLVMKLMWAILLNVILNSLERYMIN